MPRATVEDNAKLIADAFSGVTHTNPRSRALGRYTNGVLENTTNSELSGAFDWVFDPLDPLRSSVPVLNVKTEHAPGLAVIVAYNRYTKQDEVTGIDTGIAPEQFGSAAAGLNSPQKPANIPTPTTARDIIPGGVFADAGGGLNVRVGAYQHDSGYWADADYLTLAPTATSSRKSFAVVGVNRSTNELTYTLTADRVTALTLVANGAPTSYAQTDIQAVIDAAPDTDWRGAVELTHGDTTINSAKIIPLNWIRAEMTGADGSNAGVRGLVPTPAATDNTKYLRGDGTWQTVIVASDAATVTYTPAAGSDPGNVDDALDDLRTRMTDAESDIAGLSSGGISAAGWVSAGETWTYASADDPTYTFTISGDLTTKYSAGMRVRVSQTTGGTKYFIITKVAYSAPDTTITIYGGTDYDLANEAINSPNYAVVKAPYGMPLDPTKWTVETSDTTLRSQGSPTANTWYNINSTTISIPIGAWHVSYQVGLRVERATNGTLDVGCTLSTANNTESDSSMSVRTVGANSTVFETEAHRWRILDLTSKTSYYLNTRCVTSSMGTIYNMNSVTPLAIRAVCVYL